MRRHLPFALLGVFFLACGKPPTPEELAAQTTTDVEDFWKEAVATARITNTMQVRDELFSNIEGVQRYPGSSRPTIPDSSTTTEAFGDFRTIATRVFKEGNVTERGGTMLTFRVTGMDFCTPVHGTSTASSTCVANVDKLKLLIRASAGSSGTDLTLLLNETIELGTVQIQKGVSFGVTVDLGNAQKASEFVNTTLGRDSPFTRLTFVAAGKVEAKLKKWGPSDFEATVSFLSDVSGTVTDDVGYTRSGKSPSRAPLASARIDGPNKTLTASVDVGATEYRGIWADFFDYKIKSPMTWTLAGLTLRASAKDGGARTVTGLSFGDGSSTLKFGEVVVAAFDFNPNAKRQVDLELSTGGSGLDALTVRPGISSTVALTLQAVANAGQQVDATLLNSTYQYVLSASDNAPQFELTRVTQSQDGAWKLTHGSVALSTPAGGSTRTFNAVSCMTFRTRQLMSNENALLDLFTTFPCP